MINEYFGDEKLCANLQLVLVVLAVLLSCSYLGAHAVQDYDPQAGDRHDAMRV